MALGIWAVLSQVPAGSAFPAVTERQHTPGQSLEKVPPLTGWVPNGRSPLFAEYGADFSLELGLQR